MKNNYDQYVQKAKIDFCCRITELSNQKKQETGKTNEIQSREMGLSKGNLSKYKLSNDFNKEYNIPTPGADLLIRMADYYGVSTDYLLGFTDFEKRVEVETLNLDSQTKKRIVCDYLGLNETSVETLRMVSKDPLAKFVINFILKSKEILDVLTDFYTSALLRFFSESDYSVLKFNSTPAKQMALPEERMKVCFADLLDKLPLSRKEISDTVAENTRLKTLVAYFFARKIVNPDVALADVRDNGGTEYKLKMIKEIASGTVPHGEDRFTFIKATTDAIDSFKNVLSDMENTQDNEVYSDEIDWGEEELIPMSISDVPPIKETAFSKTSFVGVKGCKVQNITRKKKKE